MKIGTARVTNFARIRFAEIKPESAVFVIGGRNAQGKSSLITALIVSLGGKALAPPLPVRKGSKKAETVTTIVNDEGQPEFTIRQYFTETGGYGVKVSRADGATYPNAQTFLDRFFTKLNFDPLSFLRQKPLDQKATLQRVLGIDTAEIELKRKQIFEERTEVNRDVKQFTALKEAAEFFPDAPDEERPASELVEKLQKAEAWNRSIENAIYQASLREKELESAKMNVESLRKQAAELLAKAKSIEEDAIPEIERELTELQSAASLTPKEIGPIKHDLDNLEEVNRQVRCNATHRNITARLIEHKTKSESLTRKLELLDQEAEKKLKEAKFPIEGIALTEEGVTFNTIPLEQASQAEQLRIAFHIAIAQRPECKVFFSKEGSLFDPQTLQVIEEEAERAGVQIILERVEDDEHTSVVIEDGVIVGQEQPSEELQVEEEEPPAPKPKKQAEVKEPILAAGEELEL